jgi:hypothetical protein
MDEARYCDESESSYDMVDAVESVGMSLKALFSSSERTTTEKMWPPGRL